MMEVKGKSTLMGFNYRLVGFVFSALPEGGSKKGQVTFFQQQSESGLFLICLSVVSKQQIKIHKPQLKSSLGSIVGPEEVVPYVQRSIEGAEYAQFKGIIAEGFPESASWFKPNNDLLCRFTGGETIST